MLTVDYMLLKLLGQMDTPTAAVVGERVEGDVADAGIVLRPDQLRGFRRIRSTA